MAKVDKKSESKVSNVNREQEQYKRRRSEALQHIDVLKMYFMEPFDVTDKIKIYQPTVGQILKFGENGQYGEKDFYSSINIFVSNTTSYRLQLWDMKIDWNKISDYELFTMLIGGVNDDVQRILFGDVNLKALKPYAIKNPESEKEQESELGNNIEGTQDGVHDKNHQGQEQKPEQGDTKKTEEKKHDIFTLYDPENDIELNEEAYKKMANYIRVMFNIYPKVEFAKGKSTKEALIFEEREKLARKKNEPESEQMLFPMISACINHPGFKYRMDELKDLGIVAFMDSVQRLQIYENSTALLKGQMSGFVDTQHINADEMNFMRDLYGA